MALFRLAIMKDFQRFAKAPLFIAAQIGVNLGLGYMHMYSASLKTNTLVERCLLHSVEFSNILFDYSGKTEQDIDVANSLQLLLVLTVVMFNLVEGVVYCVIMIDEFYQNKKMR